ncbi:unnamed protein product [marine sediment metagenome]|uniref:ParB/Sulfiredoxin domain-containing protein n=1 Tax=marine sediment metagenome TaxID=412755 RepID=X0TAG4_9ZZZZ
MFTKIKKESITLNVRRAEELLKLNVFKNQRPLRPMWVNDLTNKMREGLFTSGHIAVAIYNGEKYLVNGQHQCHSAIISKMRPDVIYEEYRCDTMDDVSLLYGQFDNHKSRSLQNLVAMEMEALGLDWPRRVGSLVVSGAAMREGIGAKSKDVKVPLLKKYLPSGKQIKNILTDVDDGDTLNSYRHLTRAPVIHAMILTLEKSQSDSWRFWVDVRDGEGMKRVQPQYKLREFLKESNFDKGRGASGNNRRTVGQHEMTSRCIIAWNAYRKNITTNLKYHPTKPIPRAV